VNLHGFLAKHLIFLHIDKKTRATPYFEHRL